MTEEARSRGTIDERGWSSSSVVDDSYGTAIGNEPYVMTDAELARLPAGIRERMLARRTAGATATARLMAARERDIAQRNRAAAVRPGPEIRGVPQWIAQCACRWHSLLSPDAEVVRREYDAHACSISGDHAVDRAVAEVDRSVLAKRDAEQMVVAPSLVTAEPETVETTPTVVDDTEQRFALLELK